MLPGEENKELEGNSKVLEMSEVTPEGLSIPICYMLTSQCFRGLFYGLSLARGYVEALSVLLFLYYVFTSTFIFKIFTLEDAHFRCVLCDNTTGNFCDCWIVWAACLTARAETLLDIF